MINLCIIYKNLNIEFISISIKKKINMDEVSKKLKNHKTLLIGNSGIGKYHGYESFKTFSHFKPYIIKSNIFDLKFKYKLSKDSNIFKLTKKLIKYISI